MSRKISDRSKAIRSAGLNTDHKNIVEGLQSQYRRRVNDPSSRDMDSNSATPNCPRCGNTTVVAKLSHGEEVDYCGRCRWSIPHPDQDS